MLGTPGLIAVALWIVGLVLALAHLFRPDRMTTAKPALVAIALAVIFAAASLPTGAALTLLACTATLVITWSIFLLPLAPHHRKGNANE